MNLDDRVSIPEAVDRLIHALKADEGYYISWQANIAVQFQDECKRFKAESDKDYLSADDIHGISNKAAKNFLDLLIKQGDPYPDESHFDPVPEAVILTDNGGSMSDAIDPPEDVHGKSAYDLFPEVLDHTTNEALLQDLPEVDDDDDDEGLRAIIKDREDQDEIKVDPKDL